MSLVVLIRLSAFVVVSASSERVAVASVLDLVLALRMFIALMMLEISGKDEVVTAADSVLRNCLEMLAVLVTVAVTILLISRTKAIVALLVTVADTLFRIKVVPTAGPCP